ncbi:MAG: hypothetical protein LBT86_05420 [Deltaproteobacteria bacterium]|jgi:hypothetical protein|nr:hypothetical protein [Deltaproteobacteria bacterium]
METRAKSQYSEDNDHTARLITQVAAKPAQVSDARAVIPAIEDTISQELAPNTPLASAADGGDENVQAAAEMGVELAYSNRRPRS